MLIYLFKTTFSRTHHTYCLLLSLPLRAVKSLSVMPAGSPKSPLAFWGKTCPEPAIKNPLASQGENLVDTAITWSALMMPPVRDCPPPHDWWYDRSQCVGDSNLRLLNLLNLLSTSAAFAETTAAATQSIRQEAGRTGQKKSHANIRWLQWMVTY